jgi:hypothetical protein
MDKCIRHTHAHLKTRTWCGKEIAMDWYFENLDHAAYAAVQGCYLLPCRKCLAKAIKAMRQREVADNLATLGGP